MEEMTWLEIIGARYARFKWCQDCYRNRWFHTHVQFIKK